MTCCIGTITVCGDVGKEAQLLFSTLLSVLGTDEGARQHFGEGWTRVPLHMLLPWSAQMLSLLDGAQGETLLPLLQVCALQTYSHGQLSSLWNPCLNFSPLAHPKSCCLPPSALCSPFSFFSPPTLSPQYVAIDIPHAAV